MQFVRYNSGDSTAWGVQTDETIHSLAGLPQGEPSVEDLTNPSYLSKVATLVEHGSLTQLAVDDVSLLAPVPDPGKIICAGLNYRDHAEEQDEEIPENPILFSKASTTVTNPGNPIVHPGNDEEVDYEVELGVVVGRTAKDIEPEEVDDHVAGYTVLNDVSGRAAQFSDGQYFRGKSYDTFSPMGPTLVAGDDIDPNSLDVELRVNDEVKQSSNTHQFIFDVQDLLSYISKSMTLEPGDVISTGTPGGVGIFREPVDLLEPGDVCEAEIEAIGTLTNPVVSK
ncbi:2-keto-4-pentenoate hydratase/2-oxohepta-3-ene-1,7-dioic acid hydratase (catechol pathway) [Halogranum rubrum]|uniref:2-keto-4-pentenoate hydratase/2-oxohepta-3-ene-1,7-dioic acid hydratase (Catechol pathway) n=1 Tax=Halogranum rubrum TaxID=553466 RepID=A0A1I4GVX6_9EURY|nr:fumarylacetoacetate hydrolase family protein [Halogranum rubrum]SFL34232.1 2-keto-4-pentenoate hydratase/2-oxohepta-3-ene-1,7-dioic acid hydratase (catechol pathway) [Halogranum rubrum]